MYERGFLYKIPCFFLILYLFIEVSSPQHLYANTHNIIIMRGLRKKLNQILKIGSSVLVFSSSLYAQPVTGRITDEKQYQENNHVQKENRTVLEIEECTSLKNSTPGQKPVAISSIPVYVFYDEEMREEYCDGLEQKILHDFKHVQEIVRYYRSEELVPIILGEQPSPDHITDSSYRLRKLTKEQHMTDFEITVYLTKQRLRDYDYATPRYLLGHAKTDANVALVCADNEDQKIILLHELGHLYGLVDIDLPGGNGTYGIGNAPELDVGNIGILKQSAGPLTNDPLSYEKKFINECTTEIGVNTPSFIETLWDALLYNPTKHNTEYVRAKRQVLLAVPKEQLSTVIIMFYEHEYTPQQGKLATKNNEKTGAYYWSADATYKKGNYAAAKTYIAQARTVYDGNDTRIQRLLSAAEKEITDALLNLEKNTNSNKIQE